LSHAVPPEAERGTALFSAIQESLIKPIEEQIKEPVAGELAEPRDWLNSGRGVGGVSPA